MQGTENTGVWESGWRERSLAAGMGRDFQGCHLGVSTSLCVLAQTGLQEEEERQLMSRKAASETMDSHLWWAAVAASCDNCSADAGVYDHLRRGKPMGTLVALCGLHR